MPSTYQRKSIGIGLITHSASTIQTILAVKVVTNLLHFSLFLVKVLQRRFSVENQGKQIVARSLGQFVTIMCLAVRNRIGRLRDHMKAFFANRTKEVEMSTSDFIG